MFRDYETMLKRYFLLMLLILLTSCAHYQKTTVMYTPKVSPPPSVLYIKPPFFNQIDLKGRLNVHLHTGYKVPEIIISGNPCDIVQVKIQVKQNTLYIFLASDYPRYGEVNIEVKGHFLNKFKYVGTGTITGDHLHARFIDLCLANRGSTRLGGMLGVQHLDVFGPGVVQIRGVSSSNLQVHLKDGPKVQLAGVMNLRELQIDGTAWFSAYWIKSNHLIIRARKASKIQLAGTVSHLDIELWDNAQFKGRYLRAKRSFAKTHNHSLAEIFSRNHQSTLATDASDIYYYNHPATRADFMGYDGSVLDLREWSPFDPQYFTRYNKQFP